MKYVPIFDEVTSALNFRTPDCRVIGGCDLYTTKAAGSDKKLYRNIEYSLESQYESLLKYSVSISPPQKDLSPRGLSRPSPFGSLSQISSRRTFAYLIATLNASHPDYDFSHILSPADFCRERSLKSVVHNIDSILNSLKPSTSASPVSYRPKSFATTPSIPLTAPTWSSHFWSIIDKEMVLRDCTVYSWSPSDEPFDGDQGSIWRLNYFFFNKGLKRVTYLHARAVTLIDHSTNKTNESFSNRTMTEYESEANKRAKYWLGDRAADVTYMEQADLDEEDDFLWNNDAELNIEKSYSQFDEDDSLSDDDRIGSESDGFHGKEPDLYMVNSTDTSTAPDS